MCSGLYKPLLYTAYVVSYTHMKKPCSKCKKVLPESSFNWNKPNKRRADCKKCEYDMKKIWYLKNPKKLLGYRVRMYALRKQRSRERKLEVLSKYGGHCKCCGEKEILFLSIDHIDGGGSKHRKKLGIQSGEPFYRWLVKNNFPSGFQVLCFNCNMAKGFHNKCPHTK